VVRFSNSAAQGANLQLARKSMQLPKCLSIDIKGPHLDFFGGQQPFTQLWSSTIGDHTMQRASSIFTLLVSVTGLVPYCKLEFLACNLVFPNAKHHSSDCTVVKPTL